MARGHAPSGPADATEITQAGSAISLIPAGSDFWIGDLGMGSKVTSGIYVVAMAAIVVAVDILFFKNRFWERLMANIGIVLVFAAFWFRFLQRP